MKYMFKHLIFLFVVVWISGTFINCNKDEPMLGELTGTQTQFNLSAVSGSSISGTVTFEERSDNTTRVTIQLNGTTSGNSHPAHIHADNAATGGGIEISLNNVDGETGTSVTEVSEKDDGSAVTYADLIDYDGYVNVHSSQDDLGTLISQGDIGQNVLTGNQESYELFSVSDPAISGEAFFQERKNGETLVTIELDGDAADSDHPAHIHQNSAAEGGGILISLANVKNGLSKTNITEMDDGTAVTYTQLESFNGYINVHSSSDDLGTLVAQGDIGENELTTDSESYDIHERDGSGISGTATFTKRVGGHSLITLSLTGTANEADHPSHIHMNTALEGGGIAISLTNVAGSGGISKTTVRETDSETPVTYDELLVFDGYINIHQSPSNLQTIVAQGDIGQNAFTGNSETYTITEVDGSGINGDVTFEERNSGATLITISLTGVATDADHPAHIHDNDVATGGGIAISLTNVDGTGGSKTNVEMKDDETPITYDDLISYDGYVNIHQSPSDLGTTVANGNIGQNAN